MDEGFPQGARIKRSVEFRQIQKTGRRIRSRFLVVCFCETSQKTSRFGLTVSRKVGNAVTRNRVKRWLRESIRKNRHDVSSLDVVFIARPAAARAGQARIESDVLRSFRSMSGSAE